MTRRDGITTIHEPFGDAFYFGPERMSSRFEDDEKARIKSGFSESTFRSVFEKIQHEAATGKRVIIKDMAHYWMPPNQQQARIAPSLHRIKRGVGTDVDTSNGTANGSLAAHLLDDIPREATNGVTTNGVSTNGDTHPPPLSLLPFPYPTTTSEGPNPTVIPHSILSKFHFTFLIRHPRASIPSYYRCCIEPLLTRTQFTPFMPAEAGYDELRRLFDYLRDQKLVGPAVAGQGEGQHAGPGEMQICVIDADDMLDNPEGVLSTYCRSIGLEWNKEMLNWDSEEAHEFAREQFEKWNGFHDDAINSTDLKPRVHKHAPKSDDELFAEWTEKYGPDAAKVIRQTVEDNVADYEYLRQFAIRV